MAERFINLRTWEVRAFLAGKKTRLTRVVKPQPVEEDGIPLNVSCDWYYPTVVDRHGEEQPAERLVFGFSTAYAGWPCPLGGPGDVLIGREAWQDWCPIWNGAWCGCGSADMRAKTHRPAYMATPDEREVPTKWRSSSTMPRWASRIRLHVEAVRVQRVQEITEEEAIAEGMTPRPHEPYDCFDDPRAQYEWQWNEDNKRHPWANNPWTWTGTVRAEVARG